MVTAMGWGERQKKLTGHGLASHKKDRDGALMKTIHAPERTVERAAGCWNCKHFENGALAVSHYATCRNRDAKVLLEAKLGAGRPFERAAREVEFSLSRQDELIKPPRTGICLKGRGEADFVMSTFRCEEPSSSWEGRVRPEGPAEATIGEEYDKRGEEPPK